jgi:hypothetical protein
MTAQQLIEAALRDIGVLYTGQSSNSDQQTECLQALQMMLRTWSAQRLMVYYIVEGESFTLTAGTTKYTIGSGGDFDTVRPIKILGAYIASGVDYPLTIIDRERYRNISVKTLGDVPSWLWYNPVYPLGEIYLYPTGGGTIYLDSQKPLAEPAAIGSTISFAPEYDEAIEYNLARKLAIPYNKEVTADLRLAARDSKDQIMALNASMQVEEAEVEILSLNRAYSIEGG